MPSCLLVKTQANNKSLDLTTWEGRIFVSSPSYGLMVRLRL